MNIYSYILKFEHSNKIYDPTDHLKKNRAVELGIGGGSSSPVFLLSCHTEHPAGDPCITKRVGVSPDQAVLHDELGGLQLSSDTICLEMASV